MTKFFKELKEIQFEVSICWGQKIITLNMKGNRAFILSMVMLAVRLALL